MPKSKLITSQIYARAIRIFYLLCIGIGLGFPIFAVIVLVARAITGAPVQGVYSMISYAFAYTIAFIIGIPASKKIQERFYPVDRDAI